MVGMLSATQVLFTLNCFVKSLNDKNVRSQIHFDRGFYGQRFVPADFFSLSPNLCLPLSLSLYPLCSVIAEH